jgi:hypothetical protein
MKTENEENQQNKKKERNQPNWAGPRQRPSFLARNTSPAAFPFFHCHPGPACHNCLLQPFLVSLIFWNRPAPLPLAPIFPPERKPPRITAPLKRPNLHSASPLQSETKTFPERSNCSSETRTSAAEFSSVVD